MTNQATPQQIIEVGRRTIHAEALALKHMEEALGDEFVRAVELILSCRGKLIVTGMGKSGHIARKIAATLASTGTPSFFLHPAEAFHGDLGMISPEDVVLALSYSGETDEILKIVPFIHTNGNPLISMTGNAQSSLARNSDAHLDIMVRKEACILHLAPTSSTTAQLAMGDALAATLMHMRGFTAMDFARLHPGGSLGRRLLMTVGNVMRSADLPVVAPDCSAKDMIHTVSKGRSGPYRNMRRRPYRRHRYRRRHTPRHGVAAGRILQYTRYGYSYAQPEMHIARGEAHRGRKEDDPAQGQFASGGRGGKLLGVIQIYDIKL